MCFHVKAFWLFWLTFVSMHHNQLNTKAAQQTISTVAAVSVSVSATSIVTTTITAASSIPVFDHRTSIGNTLPHDDYEDTMEDEEATTRQVSGEIITIDKDVKRPANQIETSYVAASIEDTGGGGGNGGGDGEGEGIAEISTTTTHKITTKRYLHDLKNTKNSKNSAKTISDNFVWDFKENVAKLFENGEQKENHSNSAVYTSEIVNPTRSNTNTFSSVHSNSPERRHLVPEKLHYTKEITIKQGRLMGIVRSFQSATGLRDVDQYLGLPYAEAPTGSRRFMPPGTPLPWSGLKIARHLPPVCPQKLPDISIQGSAKMTRGRYRHLTRLMPYLKNESEDCLYINVYVPKDDGSQQVHPYPVIVYLHGESFEWNSGNAYDGSVLASYGEVIVVTVNYRLGLMGFMKPGISDATIANFGLLDQIAALHWIKENIIAFGGDKDKVTLMGHGTGAACVNYLMISPVAAGLFHRAILMSGSTMSDWASSNHSLQLTMQIAHALDCPLNDDNEQMMSCLRQKRYQELLKIPVMLPQFSTALGPIVDGHVIPDQPYKAMGQYTELFSRYDLLFGITESESYHTLGALELEEGLRENERDNLLRFYMQSRYDIRPDLALAATLKKYNDMYNNPIRATNLEHRDVVLDILSDARIVGPLMQTGLFHAEVNRHNYMYVFGHNSANGPYSNLPHSIAGEELAFVFGAPLAPAGLFHGNNYTVQEKLLSEAIMAYWTNFAKTGNPKAPWKGTFLNLHAMEWERYDLDWPEFNKRNQAYMNIGIPPSIGYKYRQIYMNFWNKELPDELNQIADIQQQPYMHGQYLPSSVAGNTHSIQNYPTRRQGSEVITGHLNKYGTRDNGAEDPVRTLKLLMQEAGRTMPIGDVEAENMYNAPPTFGVAKQSEDEVFGVQTMPTNILHQYGLGGGRLDSAGDGSRSSTIIYGIKQSEFGNGASESNSIENVVNADGISGMSTADSSREEVAKSESTLQLLIGLIAVFIILNVIIYSTFLLQKKRKKNASALGMQRKLGGILSYDGTTDDELKRSKQTTQHDGDESYILDVVRKSNTYEAVRTVERSPINGYKITRQLSSSTVDTHTKVSEWISAAAGVSVGGIGGTLMRFPKMAKKSESPDFSTLRGSSGGGTTTAGSFAAQPKRVSVAIDATPQARSNSILCQEPIEVTKFKAEGGKIIICEDVEVMDQELLTPQISLDASDYMLMRQHSNVTEPSHAILHQYSHSDPIDIYYSNLAFDDEKITSFMDDVDRFSDINVTSRSDADGRQMIPLTPEQQLLAIKRRNYPKVLPTKSTAEGSYLRDTDSPPMTADLSTTSYKRNSLPPNSFMPTFNSKQIAPAPPPRTISTLGRKPSKQPRRDSNDITTSPLRLAYDTTLEENEQEPEITQNTLIVGPIVPKVKVSGNISIGEGNYMALSHSDEYTLESNEAQSTTNDDDNDDEVTILDKDHQHRAQVRPAALCLTSLSPALSGAFRTFESAQNTNDIETLQRDGLHTTEKVYAIKESSAIPVTPTTPTLYSPMSSAATTPSTVPATSPILLTPTMNTMNTMPTSKLTENKSAQLHEDSRDDGAGSSAAIIYAQPNKQAIKGNVTTPKSNIPLRIATPKSVGIQAQASTQNELDASLLSAVMKTPSLRNLANCNQVQTMKTAETAANIKSHSQQLTTMTGDAAIANVTTTNLTADTLPSAIPIRMPQLNRSLNAQQAIEKKNNTSTPSLLSMEEETAQVTSNLSSTITEGRETSLQHDSEDHCDHQNQPQTFKPTSQTSAVSLVSSSASCPQKPATLSSYSTDSTTSTTSSSSSSTDTVRTELKQK